MVERIQPAKESTAQEIKTAVENIGDVVLESGGAITANGKTYEPVITEVLVQSAESIFVNITNASAPGHHVYEDGDYIYIIKPIGSLEILVLNKSDMSHRATIPVVSGFSTPVMTPSSIGRKSWGMASNDTYLFVTVRDGSSATAFSKLLVFDKATMTQHRTYNLNLVSSTALVPFIAVTNTHLYLGRQDINLVYVIKLPELLAYSGGGTPPSASYKYFVLERITASASQTYTVNGRCFDIFDNKLYVSGLDSNSMANSVYEYSLDTINEIVGGVEPTPDKIFRINPRVFSSTDHSIFTTENNLLIVTSSLIVIFDRHTTSHIYSLSPYYTFGMDTSLEISDDLTSIISNNSIRVYQNAPCVIRENIVNGITHLTPIKSYYLNANNPYLLVSDNGKMWIFDDTRPKWLREYKRLKEITGYEEV